jgi:hypothetical protein
MFVTVLSASINHELRDSNVLPLNRVSIWRPPCSRCKEVGHSSGKRAVVMATLIVNADPTHCRCFTTHAIVLGETSRIQFTSGCTFSLTQYLWWDSWPFVTQPLQQFRASVGPSYFTRSVDTQFRQNSFRRRTASRPTRRTDKVPP